MFIQGKTSIGTLKTITFIRSTFYEIFCQISCIEIYMFILQLCVICSPFISGFDTALKHL